MKTLKAELAEVKGEMKNMDRNFTNEIGTVRGEMTKLRGSVEAVRTAMMTGKVEMTSETTIVKREICELGQVETKNQELGTVKEELKEVTDAGRQRTGKGRIVQNKRGADTNRNGKGH